MSTSKHLSIFEGWFKSLKIIKANNGPANGTIAAALVLLERLKENYDLNFGSHVAGGGAQIKGVSGKAVAEILIKFNETRPFAKEGGRTNRGSQGDVKPLFEALSLLHIEKMSLEERNEILSSFQQFLVERIHDFHNRQKIRFIFDQKLSTWQIIHTLLEDAKSEGKAGSVAQHLTGAKLQIRFPEISISNESVSTADLPTNRPGDFFVGNAVFHITVSPMQALFEKCNQNLDEGMKVYLLVPDAKLATARQMADQICGGHIAVESLESFISQNIEEISVFSFDRLKHSLSKLINVYNERVNAVEIDKSLLIEIPANLK